MTTDPEQAQIELERLRRENAELRRRWGRAVGETPGGYGEKAKTAKLPPQQPLQAVTNDTTVQEKITLFRSLFRGRDDVYAAFRPRVCPERGNHRLSSAAGRGR